MTFNGDSLNFKKVAWLTVLPSICVIALCIFNLRATFWDADLFPFVHSGKIAHYYINYFDFGFAKRGLVGTIIKIPGSIPSVNFIRYLALGIGISVCGVIACFLFQLRSYFDNVSYVLFAGLLIFNSGTLPNLAYDLGRYDQLLILCAVFSLYYIYKEDLLKLTLLSIVALLIHELYLIMFLPMLLYIAAFHSKFEVRELGYLLGVIASILAILFFFGKIESKSVQEIATTVTVENFEFRKVGTIWKNTLLENFEYTMNYVGGYYSGKIIGLALGGLYTAVTLLVLIMISTHNNLDWRGLGVIFFASLPMFLLGIDYSRWYSLMIINGFIYFIYLVINSKSKQVKITRAHQTVISLLFIIGIILGPIGIIRSLPLINIFSLW